jgi:hypothetical protein
MAQERTVVASKSAKIVVEARSVGSLPGRDYFDGGKWSFGRGWYPPEDSRISGPSGLVSDVRGDTSKHDRHPKTSTNEAENVVKKFSTPCPSSPQKYSGSSSQKHLAMAWYRPSSYISLIDKVLDSMVIYPNSWGFNNTGVSATNIC